MNDFNIRKIVNILFKSKQNPQPTPPICSGNKQLQTEACQSDILH